MGQVGRVGPALPSKQSLGVPTGVGARSIAGFKGALLSRAPLFTRVLRPIYVQIIVYSTLIYH